MSASAKCPPALGRTYNYDNAGKLLTVTESDNAAADVSNVYDAMGRLTAESSRGQTHQYVYDLAGNRVQATYSTGRVVQTSYDGLNRPEVISEGGRVTRYGYDLAGRAVVLVGGNGQVSSNTYDALGRLVDRTLFKTAEMDPGQVLAEFSWEHDLLGNVKKQYETWPGDLSRAQGIRTISMSYDVNNRLTTEVVTQPEVSGATPTTTTAYTYDNANNRATKTVSRTIAGEEPISDEDTGYWSYTYNEANQLTEWEKRSAAGQTVQKSVALTYDAAGNRSSQVVTEAVEPTVYSTTQPPAAKPGTTTYHWDAQDRLLGVTLPDGSVHSYEYDYRTRRIGTDTKTTANAVTSKQTTIVFSGGLSVAEWESDTGSLPVSPTVEYTRGPDMGGGVGGLLYSLRTDSGSSTSTAKYNLSNGRGDIVAQANQGATLTWTASYEAYGKRTKETGANLDKQRGNSKDEDPTGLLNEGFRYRDLETGVWLSRDPAGFVDGPNLYAYVMQNPWTAFDPDGLATKSQLHKQRRYLIKRRDAEKSLREKNGESVSTLGINAQGDGTVELTEFGEVMDAFNTEIRGVESRIQAIDKAVDNHNFLMDVGSVLTGVSQNRMKVSRVQFDDEDPKYQPLLKTSERFQDIKNDVAINLLTGGAGKIIQVGGKGLRLLSPAANMMNGCFVAGTVVKTKDGDRPIEKTKKGDHVWSFNQAKNTWELKEVLAALVHDYSGLIYTLKTGNVVIEATANHPFWVTSGIDLSVRPNAEDVPLSEQEPTREGRWVAAEHLRTGDTFILRDGGFSEISAIKSESRSIQVFNITVEESHNYAVAEAGVLVHNKAVEKIIRFGDNISAGAATFHSAIKPNILSKAGKFQWKVGKNPDIKVVNGKIQLQGTGPFKGKSTSTDLDASDFFK